MFLFDITKWLGEGIQDDVVLERLRSRLLLSPEEHLSYLYRYCAVHAKRRIKLLKAPERVKAAARRLFTQHSSSWDADIALIKSDPAGFGAYMPFLSVALLINILVAWWKDKEDSILSWAGISLMFSKIPEDIWVAGPSHTNTGEAAHYDIQREGVHLPLFVGILVGRRSDLNALKSRAAFDELGVKDVYRSKEASALIQRNDQRQSSPN
jgi:hypothetical protein